MAICMYREATAIKQSGIFLFAMIDGEEVEIGGAIRAQGLALVRVDEIEKVAPDEIEELKDEIQSLEDEISDLRYRLEEVPKVQKQITNLAQ